MQHHKIRKNILSLLACLIMLTSAFVYAKDKTSHEVEDLDYGVSLYNFYQDKYFSAITSLLVAEHYQRISSGSFYPDLMLGGLYLAYGLNDKSADALNELLTDKNVKVTAEIHDVAWYLLGKNFYLKGNNHRAIESLERIKNDLSQEYEEEKLYLLNILSVYTDNAEAAIKYLELLPDESKWKGYARFNTASYLIRSNKDTESGYQLLKEMSVEEVSEYESLVLKNRANLAMGLVALQENDSSSAAGFFENISLQSFETNKGLLGLGWAHYRDDNYAEAIKPWMSLATNQKDSDLAIQEALISIPYAFEKMQQKEHALYQYDLALDSYKFQLKETRDLMAFLKGDQFIEQLSPGKLGSEYIPVKYIVENFNPLINRYMLSLIISKEFHRMIEEYQQAKYLRYQLDSWQHGLPAMKMILNEKRKTHNQKLAKIVSDDSLKKVNKLSSQRDDYALKLEKIVKDEDTLALMTVHEKEMMSLLDNVKLRKDSLDSGDEEVAAIAEKWRLMNGLMKWRLESEYPERLWVVRKKLNQLDKAVLEMSQSVNSLKAAWNTAPEDFASFDERIENKEEQIIALKRQAEDSIEWYQSKLRGMFVKHLRDYRNQLKLYHDRALYAKARLYDSLMARE